MNTVAKTSEEQLRDLVRHHRRMTHERVAIINRISDKTLEDGTIVPCRLDQSTRSMYQKVADHCQSELKTCEHDMKHALKTIPVYEHFLSKVYGCGVVTAAYMIGEIDCAIKEKTGGSTKPSAIIKYCGYAIENGRLDRMNRGKTRQYNGDLRDRMYIMWGSLYKNCSRMDKSCKYLDIYLNKKQGVLTRAVDGKIVSGDKTSPEKGFSHSAAWHTAIRVFLEDFYVVQRAVLGLPVWPTWSSVQSGYAHGGRPVTNQPTNLTVQQALSLVGDVTAYELNPVAAE